MKVTIHQEPILSSTCTVHGKVCQQQADGPGFPLGTARFFPHHKTVSSHRSENILDECKKQQ